MLSTMSSTALELNNSYYTTIVGSSTLDGFSGEHNRNKKKKPSMFSFNGLATIIVAIIFRSAFSAAPVLLRNLGVFARQKTSISFHIRRNLSVARIPR